MEVTVADMVLCGCFSAVDNIDPSIIHYYAPSNLVGVNGVWTLDAISPGDPANTAWTKVIGTVDLQEYSGPPDEPCTVPIGDPFTSDISLSVQCFPEQNGGLQALMTVVDLAATSAGPVFASTDFSPETWFQPGDIVANVAHCVLDGLGYYSRPLAEGDLVVTAP